MFRKNRRIYLATSWRNELHTYVLGALREAGHEVYDFKNPSPGNKGFAWKEITGIGPELKTGSVSALDLDRYLNALGHPIAQRGFRNDYEAMIWADTFVLLLPCGRSAHLEAGWAIGAGRDTHIVLSQDTFTPELMYLLAARIHINPINLLHNL